MAAGEDTWGRISEIRSQGLVCVVVTITACRGSVPGVTGAKAVVSEDGLELGTLGGGKVEAKALEFAERMLRGGEPCTSVTWNLQRDVEMTCGGEMSFLFERVEADAGWHVVIFGAGHVVQALVPVLAAMRCRIDVIDERNEWLQRIPVRPNVTTHLFGKFEEGVSLVTEESMVLSITKGHSTDRPVLRDLLSHFPEIGFLGVIGSAAKRAVLLRELREDGLSESLLEKIVCPVGLPIGGNDPAEIAVSIAAQLLERREA